MHQLQQTRQRRNRRDWLFDVENESLWLMPILNGEHPDVSRQCSKRIRQMLVDLQDLEKIRLALRPMRCQPSKESSFAWQPCRFGDKKAEALNQTGRILVASINERLTKCVWYPELLVESFDHLPRYIQTWNEKTESHYFENLSMRMFLDRIAEGRIHWYKTCADCRRWFSAKTEHQKFCNEKCRLHHHANSDGFRKKRADYMRLDYRPKMKQRDERAHSDGEAV